MYHKLSDVLSGNEKNFMLPFYWLHGNHYETIPQEVERIYNSGCRAFCVESRPHEDFAGPGWWRDMDLILQEARKRDMQVWILDDDHFPTGNAAGHIKNFHPDKRRWDIGERHVDVAGPLKDALLLTNETEKSRLLGVFAYRRPDESEACDDQVLDFSDCVNDKFCQITVPEGLWRVFFIYKTRDLTEKADHIDMLSQESVRVLIDAVYEPHYAHYKQYFGNTIQGFFSDEPSLGNAWFSGHVGDPGMYERKLGMLGMAYSWRPEVLEMMQAALGYDPMPYIAALWTDLGERTAAIRYAYMDAVTRLYRQNFTRQVGDWCKDHGVGYIGHVIEDMNAHKRTGCSAGHYFRALDGQTMSGMDIVLHQILPGMSHHLHTTSAKSNRSDPEFFDYTLAKMASSLAHIGKDMNGRAMCEVFGAYGWAEDSRDMKWLLDHLLVRGVNHFVPHAFSPKFPDPDCPPHFGANGKDPQYDAFSRLMRYGNQVAHLLYGGTHIADAAILYDAEFEWMNKENTTEFMQVPAKALYDENIDFDFLPIDCIAADRDARLYCAQGENGLLQVGKESYKVLIVPYAPQMPPVLTEALNRLTQKGVKVLRMGIDCTKENLVQKVRELFTPDIVVSGQKKFLRSCHYADKQQDIYMFTNENVAECADCVVSLHGVRSQKGVCVDLLADTYYKVALEDGKMPLQLAPNQSVLFVFGDVDFDALPEKKLWQKREKADLTFTIETADAEDLKTFHLLREGVKADELFSITSLDCMPEFSGTVRYSTTFDGSALPETVGLDLVNAGTACRLFLNGEDLGVRITNPYFYDFSGKVRPGENELVIEVSNTLANKIRDRFSAHMIIDAAGLTEQPYFVMGE